MSKGNNNTYDSSKKHPITYHRDENERHCDGVCGNSIAARFQAVCPNAW